MNSKKWKSYCKSFPKCTQQILSGVKILMSLLPKLLFKPMLLLFKSLAVVSPL